MSNTVDIDYLDGEFTVQEQEPATLAELVSILGTESAVIEDATSNLRYRNKYPRVYKAVSKAIAEVGFARAVVDTKTLKGGEVRNVLESENDHLRAFLKGRPEKDETSGEDVIKTPAPPENRATLQELFAKIANEQPLFVQGERTGGGGKVSAAALEAANKFFAMGAEKVETTAAKIEELVPGYKVGRDAEGGVTPESLARGIAALDKKMIADAKAARMSQLA